MPCTAHFKVVMIVFTVSCLLAHVLLYFLAKSGVSDIMSGYISMKSGPNLTRHLSPTGQTNQQHVLLITYARSGSSFTSAIISRHPDVFFVSEPLFYLEETTNRSQVPDDRSQVPDNRSKVPDNRWQVPYFVNSFENRSRRIIETFLTCEFAPEDVSTWDNRQMVNSDDTLAFFLALHKVLKEYVTCLRECKGHRHTLVKTTRYRVRWVEWFLQHVPNIKVIYLVRDPRATLYSQARLFRSFNWTTGSIAASEVHCRLLEEDLFHLERLTKLYPRQIRGIRYEDVAMHPVDYTARMYTFLGLDMNDTVVDYVRGITEANGTNAGSNAFTFGVKKTRSSESMDVWRSVAEFAGAALTDRNCGHLYGTLGYKRAESEGHLRSRDRLHGTPEPRGIFETVDATSGSIP